MAKKATDTNVAFYKYTSTKTLPAHRAYFQPTNTNEANACYLIGNEVTGINTVQAESNEDTIYTLDGRHVKDTTKGIYIVNGKKIIKP